MKKVLLNHFIKPRKNVKPAVVVTVTLLENAVKSVVLLLSFSNSSRQHGSTSNQHLFKETFTQKDSNEMR